MIYTLRLAEMDDSDLSVLESLEENEGLKISNKNKEEKIFEIQIDSDKDKETIINFLSTYLSIKTYVVELKKGLKNHFSPKEIEAILNNHINNTSELLYCKMLTKIHLTEYFKKRQIFNSKAFLRFNMNGMRNEVKYISTLEIESGGNLVETSFEDSPILQGHSSIQSRFYAVIEQLREIYTKGIEEDYKFKDFHVFVDEDGDLVTINEAGEEVSYLFINELLGVNLTIDTGDGNPPFLDEIIKLVISIPSFAIKRVIIYEMNEDLKKTIIFNLEELKQNFETDFKVYFSEEEYPII